MTPDLLRVALDETGNSKRMAERLNLEIRIEKIQTNRVFDFRVSTYHHSRTESVIAIHC